MRLAFAAFVCTISLLISGDAASAAMDSKQTKTLSTLTSDDAPVWTRSLVDNQEEDSERRHLRVESTVNEDVDEERVATLAKVATVKAMAGEAAPKITVLNAAAVAWARAKLKYWWRYRVPPMTAYHKLGLKKLGKDHPIHYYWKKYGVKWVKDDIATTIVGMSEKKAKAIAKAQAKAQAKAINEAV